MRRRRILGLALIALAAPLPALALDGGPVEGTGPAGLTVTVSLDSCGLAGSQIMCKIDAGWNSLEGADSYSVSATGPDGSVVDMGETTGQGTSVWVPYAGAGTYSVQVTAWGTPPGEEEDGSPEVIARDSSAEGSDPSVARSPQDTVWGEAREEESSEPASEDPAVVDDVVPGEPREEAPVCEEPPIEEPPLPPEPPEESTDEEAEADDAAAEPEVVDTIPADDDCTG